MRCAVQGLIRSTLPAIALLVAIAAGAEAGEETGSRPDAPIRQMAVTVDDLPASFEQAVEDPAYARPISGYTGAGGITWLHRWAITEGVDAAVFRGEPRVRGWVEQ